MQSTAAMRTVSGATTDTRTADELVKAKIPPYGLPASRGGGVHGARDAERGVLVGHDIVLVFRVERLVLRRDVDVLYGEKRGDHGRGGGGGAVCHCCCCRGAASVVLLRWGVVVLWLLGGCRREVGVQR